MSGFEVAGVVLGTIPLLISALENYKAGKGAVASIMKWRGQLDTLIFRLKGQRMLFYFDILELLRSAGVDEVTDRIDISEEDCLLILQGIKSSEQIQDYLGIHYFLFLEIVTRYETCLKTIAAKLRHVQRLPEAPKDDLRALLEANPTVKGRFEFKQRISFSIERGILNDLVEELKEDRLSLKTIINGMRTQKEYVAGQPSQNAHRLAKALTQVQGYAKSLFMAMCRSCKCGLRDQHRVLLQLHNRIPLSKGTPRPGEKGQSQTTFHLVFDVDGDLQEATVNAEPPNINESKHSLERRQQLSLRFKTSQVAPKIVLFADPDPESCGGEEITAMCNFATEARLNGSILRLALTNNSFYSLDGPPSTRQNLVCSKSLGDFLRDGAYDEDGRLTPKEQTLLALDIASSVIQLRQTCWLESPFSSKVVKLLVRREGQATAIASTPFVEQIADPDRVGSLGPDPKTTLLELAILLLEIWHHKPLEVWSAKAGTGTVDYPEARQRAAIQWLEMTSQRLPAHHLTAIEQCLAICSGRLRFWDDFEFLKHYCENVIMPLQESCKAW